MKKTDTIYVLNLLEEINREHFRKNRSEYDHTASLMVLNSKLKHVVGDNYKKYPPIPSGISWSINYTELIELSVIGREKLRAYIK